MNKKILSLVKNQLRLTDELIVKIESYFDDTKEVCPFDAAKQLNIDFQKTLMIFSALTGEKYLVKKYGLVCPICNNIDNNKFNTIESVLKTHQASDCSNKITESNLFAHLALFFEKNIK